MKTFVYREIREPNHEKRRELLGQLAQLRKYPELKDIKRELRQSLRQTEGHVGYYLFYKGLRYFIGDALKTNKFSMINLNDDALISDLQQQRKLRKLQHTSSKKILMQSIQQYMYVHTVDGYPIEKQPYVQIVKKTRSYKATRHKRPLTNDSYVGLELEYASIFSIEEIAEKIAEAGLHDSVRIVRDGSIIPEGIFKNQVEFCILAKFSELESVLSKFKKILEPNSFLVNQSCGFHVHLDARSGDVKRMFHNLVCMQSLLFNMVAEHRQESKYCNPLTTPNFDDIDAEAQHAHWDAISKFSFYKHRTIEIRMHESTTDLTNVLKWVKLLKKIADYSGEPLKFGSFKTTLSQLSKINLEPELMSYVTEKQAI